MISECSKEALTLYSSFDRDDLGASVCVRAAV
jgi:hypothetical protein